MKIFDTQFGHAVSAGTPYNDTVLPFKWERSFEIFSEDFIFITESQYEFSKTIHSVKKILWILESPFMISEYLIQDIIANHQLFHTILTHDDRLIHLPNAKRFPIGGCWIYPQDCKVYEKTKNISTITSPKIFTQGHSIRHKISERKDIDVFGAQYQKLDYKLNALKDFQFHVCIENFKNDSYFTEKIIDCFATGTIPIYWGSNKISNIFNTNGIIEIDDYNELNYCIENIDQFKIDYEAINENFEISKEYWLPEDRINKWFLQAHN
jgi:hypothetical protein